MITQKHLPKLYGHLEDIGLNLDMVTYGWFICMFIGYIPWEASMQMLDIIFMEGSNVLFQIGLAILQLNEDAILEAEDPETVMSILRDRVYETDELLQITFAYFSYGDTIKELRASETQKELQHLRDKAPS